MATIAHVTKVAATTRCIRTLLPLTSAVIPSPAREAALTMELTRRRDFNQASLDRYRGIHRPTVWEYLSYDSPNRLRRAGSS
jgi:hypothetical protein